MPNGSALPSYLLAGVLSLLLAFWLFPVDFILGEGPYWAAPSGDRMQHIIGMRYFLADEWRFPLFQTHLIAPPEGVNIIYTDSLPLFALIAKLLRPFLPAQLNYFGVWLFLVYVLQGVAAVFLLRSLEVKGLLPNLAGAVIALSYPALLYRFGHEALCGHFLLLFAMGLYFRSASQHAFGKLWGRFALLCWLTLFVHAYLFVMVFGLFLATAVQEAFSSRAGFQKSIVSGIAVAGVSALLMWFSGYFHGVGGSGGFGYYSMNMLSPWVPQLSGLFPDINFIDGTGGQYEGFNYLGCGVLLLLIPALWVGRFEINSTLRRYWGLALLLLMLTLLAISHRVFIGQWEVLRIRANPPPLLQLFRVSGRFFWPVGYTLMAMGLAVVALKLRRPLNSALILVAAVLQFIDAGPLRENVAMGVRSGAQFNVPAEPWRGLIAAHERLTIVPSFRCTEPFTWHMLDMVFHASSSVTPVNTMHLARSSTVVDCSQEVASLRSRELSERELLVVFSLSRRKSPVIEMPGFDRFCRSFADGFACSRQWPVLEERFAGGFSEVGTLLFPYALGTEIRFTKGGNSTQYTTFGWSYQEPWGTWTEGSEAELMFRLKDTVSSDLRLTALAGAFAPNNIPPQTVEVVANGKTVGPWTLRHGKSQEVSVIIPQSIAAAASPVRLVFRIAHSSSPNSHGLSVDSRKLGMGIVWMRINRVGASTSTPRRRDHTPLLSSTPP